jgi:hypothetical protein
MHLPAFLYRALRSALVVAASDLAARPRTPADDQTLTEIATFLQTHCVHCAAALDADAQRKGVCAVCGAAQPQMWA